MAECAYCGREIDGIPENFFNFYNPESRTLHGWYVCDICRRMYMVTEEQAEEVLSEWKKWSANG